jgi:hypothetical protein
MLSFAIRCLAYLIYQEGRLIPTPIILGLAICDYVIIEEGTKKFSLVGNFSRITATSFPANVQPFSVFALLTDGLGGGTIRLIVVRLETDEEVHNLTGPIHFTDKLSEVKVHLRVRNLVVPAPGRYQFTLAINGDFIAQRVVEADYRGV